MSGFISWTGICFLVLAHPFYISMTDLNYNAKAKSMEVSVRIFTDDFEKTLRKNCNCKVDLTAKETTAAMKPLVERYILKHLQIKVNGQILALKFKGYQQEEESTWNYFEAENVQSPMKINITNTLLHDYKEEQINMLHINVKGNEKTEKLDWPAKDYSFQF